jgi:hypothetical protein
MAKFALLWVGTASQGWKLAAARPQALEVAQEAQPEGARPKGGPGQPPPLQDRVGQARLQPRDGPAPRRCAAGRSGRPKKEARGSPGGEGAPQALAQKDPLPQRAPGLPEDHPEWGGGIGLRGFYCNGGNPSACYLASLSTS